MQTGNELTANRPKAPETAIQQTNGIRENPIHTIGRNEIEVWMNLKKTVVEELVGHNQRRTSCDQDVTEKRISLMSMSVELTVSKGRRAQKLRTTAADSKLIKSMVKLLIAMPPIDKSHTAELSLSFRISAQGGGHRS
ncbi:hypothetical protein T265_06426 [Opisthorchis viverrini]|uniref:Uncharacterized protein n=1 Tax=Opisthorchis viverrini TaxID=6198 RepID=A0A075ADV5_OPIVI|nr:hypothetical protein T265_06426 [Opisthorchis viverrini]KER26309.1 hypothetical protein T265_06426 [Opisthorchis viverrini]